MGDSDVKRFGRKGASWNVPRSAIETSASAGTMAAPNPRLGLENDAATAAANESNSSRRIAGASTAPYGKGAPKTSATRRIRPIILQALRARPGSRLIPFTILLLCLFGAAAQSSAQDFYTDRLAAGKADYQAKRFADANDEFRIACFGFLDRPTLLSEGLVRLALAESAANLSDELKSTLNRFLDVERRIPSFSHAALEPEIRSQFQEVLTRLIPEAAIRAVPTLSTLVETPEQHIFKLPPKEKESAMRAKADEEPKEPRWPLELARLAAARSDSAEVVKWATRTLEISPADSDAQALRGHAFVARSEYANARADLSALPPARLDREPELLADLFVCDTALRDWEAAQALEPRLDAPALDRKDVKKAKIQLAKQAAKAQKEAQQEAVRAEKDAQREAERRPGAEPPPAPAAPVPAAAPSTAEPTPGPNPVSASLQETRQLVIAGKPAEAEEKLLPLAAANPKRRDVRIALLEVACLARDWKTGVAQAVALSPFRDGEEPSMFYAAVVLFESGDVGRAKSFLQKALPRIASTPYTQFYAKKILAP